MTLLLDTVTFLWLATGDKRLSPRALELFSDPDNDVLLSCVSSWEIALKYRLGKLKLPDVPSRFVPAVRVAHGIGELNLDEAAALHESHLPNLHTDPFDRMLVCQAILGGFTVLTPDRAFGAYGVRTAW